MTVLHTDRLDLIRAANRGELQWRLGGTYLISGVQVDVATRYTIDDLIADGYLYQAGMDGELDLCPIRPSDKGLQVQR